MSGNNTPDVKHDLTQAAQSSTSTTGPVKLRTAEDEVRYREHLRIHLNAAGSRPGGPGNLMS